MPPKKSKTDGEEKAKPLTTASSRVTRSLGRRTRSETQQNGAKAAGSAPKPVKVASPKKAKRKKPTIGTGKAKKGKKEDEAVEKEEEEEPEPEPEVEDPTKTKIVIEHCKQCNAFKTRAIQVKEGLEGAVTGCTVTLNPDKPRRGCFEIRKEGGETFISLLEMKRPFAPMKALDMEEVIENIIKKIK
ncbi:PREDICTED: selenoprotein H-like [Camelina sativa]|uniref:Selenoprotein H-like n=1 Tax=Camelina sativa TaxID=90675 RepID=A0ABM0U9U8_CAMSA|nr:PREDICTED: selenoprotein H-like [Camelina sativa]